MNIKKFNPFSIQKLKPKDKVYEVQVDDCKGLVLRIQPKGTISLIYRFQLSGSRRKMSIGSYSRDNLKHAKAGYDTAVKHVENGLDPITLRESNRHENEDNPSFQTFSERFVTHYVNVKLKESTAKEYRRQINKILIPAWSNRKIVNIERKQITKLVEGISQNAPIQANRTLATIKKIFSYALDVGVVAINPATGIKPPARENVKDRVINLNEVATLFKLLEAQDNRDTRDILQLITLTAQRPGEVAEMRISQLKEEADGTWWAMAGSDVKNKTAHRVYLNDQALRIVQNRIKDYGLNNYIFPSVKRDGSISFMRKDVIVKRVYKVMPLIEAEGIDKFTAHDLRRSAATGIAQLGHSAVVPDILNHKPQGITRQVYDKYSRQPEIKRALVSWGETIQRAVDGTQADVVSIKTANQ